MPSPDPDWILNNWECIPEPEQALFRVFGEYTQVAFGIIPFSQVVTLLTQFGAVPAQQRAEIVWTRYKFTIAPQDPFLCGDENGCLRPAAEPRCNAIWQCMLLGGCVVGAPTALPCRSPITKPYA